MTSSENADAGKHAADGARADEGYDDVRPDSAADLPLSEDDGAAPVVALRRLSPASPPPLPPRGQATGQGSSGAGGQRGPETEVLFGGGEVSGPASARAGEVPPPPPRERRAAAADLTAADQTAVVDPASRAAMTPSEWVRGEAEARGHQGHPHRSYDDRDDYGRDEYRRDDYGRESARDGARAGDIRYSAPPPATAASGAFGDGLASEFRSEQFATEVQPEPRRGWRRAVLKSSFGLVNPGESRVEREDRERVEQIRANVRGQFIFAVFSPRGGVAKTTTTAALGSMFSSLRGSEVLAMDADPDSGNLAGRINDDTSATFRDILRDRASIRGVTDVRAYTAHNSDKLDVLASSKELVRPEIYTPATLFDTVDALRGSYRVIGIDCGKRMRDPLTEAVLDMVTALVVVTSSQYDSAKAAMSFHDYLRNTGRGQLLERSFLIISDRNPVGSETRAARKLIEDHVRNVIWKDPIYVPYDPHLHEGTTINLAQLKRPSYRAYLEATARLSSWYGMPALPRGRR
ncbi:MAG: MinD/ParA family protein [Mycolicibacterium sp.]|uniref:MinD/ParA family ATP-binding protein n=1 Tax=Mycolicibacterium sp. TaxID=2320850 RepID=UPI003D146905